MLKQIVPGKNTGRWVSWFALILLAVYSNPAVGLDVSPAGLELSGVAGSEAPHFSAGVVDILKMFDAKVDIEVIKTYISNSAVPYYLNASEIIALKERGIPNEVIAALIQRGGELRAELRVQSPQSSPPPAANTYPSTVPYDSGSQTMQPYAESYPASYSYGSYPYTS